MSMVACSNATADQRWCSSLTCFDCFCKHSSEASRAQSHIYRTCLHSQMLGSTCAHGLAGSRIGLHILAIGQRFCTSSGQTQHSSPRWQGTLARACSSRNVEPFLFPPQLVQRKFSNKICEFTILAAGRIQLDFQCFLFKFRIDALVLAYVEARLRLPLNSESQSLVCETDTMQAGRAQMQRSQRPAMAQLPCMHRAAMLRGAAGSRRRAVACRASQAAERFPAQVCVVLGTQWGDEGKGKLVDILAQQYDVVARSQVGAVTLRVRTTGRHAVQQSMGRRSCCLLPQPISRTCMHAPEQLLCSLICNSHDGCAHPCCHVASSS